MRIHNLYTDENGESHFRDIEVEWAGVDYTNSKYTDIIKVSGMNIRLTDGDYHVDCHTAANDVYVINLDAPSEIVASDGESRVIGVGEMLLLQDTTGKGHMSKAVAGQIRHAVFISARKPKPA